MPTPPKKKTSKIQWKLLFYSLTISTVFWLAVKINRYYTVETDVYLKYQIPTEITIESRLPQKVQARIRAKGSRLLAVAMGIRKLEAEINISRFLELENTSLMLPMGEVLQSELSNEFEITDVYPSLFTLEFIKKKTAELPILATNIRVIPKHGFFQIGNISFEPSYVTVIADPNFFIAHNQWFTRPATIVLDDYKRSQVIPLDTVSGVYILPKETKATVFAERYCEKEFLLPLKVRNVPQNFSVKIFPKQVQVKILVSLKDYQKIKSEDLEAYVDLSYWDEEKPFAKIQTNIRALPYDIKHSFVYPAVADYTITYLQ